MQKFDITVLHYGLIWLSEHSTFGHVESVFGFGVNREQRLSFSSVVFSLGFTRRKIGRVELLAYS